MLPDHSKYPLLHAKNFNFAEHTTMHLNYKTFGQGSALIILHGLFGMLDNWQTLGKRFAAQFTVFLVDQRNHGRSFHHPDFNYRLLAEDLRQFMEDHWIYKTHLIGHSMGGKTAMQFALDHPDMVDQLIVADIAPRAYEESHLSIIEALTALDLNAISDREEAAAVLEKRISSPGMVQFLLKNLTRDKAGTFHFKMNLPALKAHYADILAAVEGDQAFEGETLFIRGENSNHILSSDWPLIQSLFPKAEMLSIPDAGHWVHADQPDVFFEATMNFLLKTQAK